MTVAFVLALTISLALRTNVIAQHCAEHEILLGSEQIERTCHNYAYGVETLLAAEVEVQAVVANWLDYVFDVLAFQFAYGKVLIFLLKVNSTIRRTPFLYSYIWFLRTFMSTGSIVDCCMII